MGRRYGVIGSKGKAREQVVRRLTDRMFDTADAWCRARDRGDAVNMLQP
jgi:hypothetical protein